MRLNTVKSIRATNLGRKTLLVVLLFAAAAGYQAYNGNARGWDEVRVLGSIISAVCAVGLIGWLLFVFDPVRTAEKEREAAKAKEQGTMAGPGGQGGQGSTRGGPGI